MKMDQADEGAGAAVEKVTLPEAQVRWLLPRLVTLLDHGYDIELSMRPTTSRLGRVRLSEVGVQELLLIVLADAQVTAPTPAQPEQKLETNLTPLSPSTSGTETKP